MSRSILQYDPVIGHTFIRGLRTRVWHESGGFLMRVNEAGFRSEHEFVREKAPGTFRVLLFGHSFPAGHGVSNPAAASATCSSGASRASRSTTSGSTAPAPPTAVPDLP